MTFEALLIAAAAAGFFGSAHCFGMCGAVVTLLEQPRLSGGAWRRRVATNIGRLSFYALLGAVAGAFGLVLTRLAPAGSGLLALRILAAALVLLLAVNLLFDWRTLRFLESAGAVLWKRMSPLARHLLPVTTTPRAFGAGFVWGALPCGLVYSAVAMAAASGTAGHGAAVMLAFWGGTLPALLVAGAMAAQVSRWSRRTAARRAGGLVLLTVGLLGIALPLVHTDAVHSGHDVHPHPAASQGRELARA